MTSPRSDIKLRNTYHSIDPPDCSHVVLGAGQTQEETVPAPKSLWQLKGKETEA